MSGLSGLNKVVNDAFSLLPPPFNLIPNFLTKDSSNITEVAGRALLPTFVKHTTTGAQHNKSESIFSVFSNSEPQKEQKLL